MTSNQNGNEAQHRFGFCYTNKSAHETTNFEKALLNAYHRWIVTDTLDHNQVLDSQKQPGKVTFLIMNGRLKFERISFAWTGCKTQYLLPNAKRQLAVRANGEYRVTATAEGGTDFLEGHVCLSPGLAARLLREGTLQWLGADGHRVPKKTILPMLDKAEIKVAKGQYAITVPSAAKDPNADLLQKWFNAEWNEYAAHRRAAQRVNYKGLYTDGASSDAQQAGADGRKAKEHQPEVESSSNDDSDTDVDSEDEEGA